MTTTPAAPNAMFWPRKFGALFLIGTPAAIVHTVIAYGVAPTLVSPEQLNHLGNWTAVGIFTLIFTFKVYIFLALLILLALIGLKYLLSKTIGLSSTGRSLISKANLLVAGSTIAIALTGFIITFISTAFS